MTYVYYPNMRLVILCEMVPGYQVRAIRACLHPILNSKIRNDMTISINTPYYIDNIDPMVYNTLWKLEFFDLLKVLESGAVKYSPNEWLDANGRRTSFKEYHDSAFHHLACSYAGIENDRESGLPHLLHAATNLLMMYTRQQRGIINDKDDN